ncbi:chitin disaccharide deacetylase [Clostridium baratii]|uniref:chitin disaccharide deacetylase n=1 Tax=Clostridium baratii TaxID=1561 RepID=UPI0029017917|nr:chitin disaccharide deacetylase [Clostridium baratii]MDU1052558.1 chitin disaccharide deacetylase [Clostridium baratii]
MRLIVNADDFGISKAINLGIIEAHREGIVRSTTLMCNMEAVDNAIKLAKENQELGVGIHFVLTAGKPLSDGVESLLDKDGTFTKFEGIAEKAKSEDIKKELECQLNKFLSYGIKPTHIDTHHHVHRIEKVFKVIKEIAIKNNLPVRLIEEFDSSMYEDIKSTSKFSESFYGKDMITEDSLIRLLDEYKDFETVEIMAHPGYLDQNILNRTSYAIERTIELDILVSRKVKAYIKEKNIELINFCEI